MTSLDAYTKYIFRSTCTCCSMKHVDNVVACSIYEYVYILLKKHDTVQ